MQPTMLAGVNFVLHTAGWLEGGLAMGYEKFVLDNDQAGMWHEFVKGVDLSDNGQALDAILDNGPGQHFLGHAHTLANFETAFYGRRSRTTTRASSGSWRNQGRCRAGERGLEADAHRLRAATDRRGEGPRAPRVDRTPEGVVSRFERLTTARASRAFTGNALKSEPSGGRYLRDGGGRRRRTGARPCSTPVGLGRRGLIRRRLSLCGHAGLVRLGALPIIHGPVFEPRAPERPRLHRARRERRCRPVRAGIRDDRGRARGPRRDLRGGRPAGRSLRAARGRRDRRRGAHPELLVVRPGRPARACPPAFGSGSSTADLDPAASFWAAHAMLAVATDVALVALPTAAVLLLVRPRAQGWATPSRDASIRAGLVCGAGVVAVVAVSAALGVLPGLAERLLMPVDGMAWFVPVATIVAFGAALGTDRRLAMGPRARGRAAERRAVATARLSRVGLLGCVELRVGDPPRARRTDRVGMGSARHALVARPGLGRRRRERPSGSPPFAPGDGRAERGRRGVAGGLVPGCGGQPAPRPARRSAADLYGAAVRRCAGPTGEDEPPGGARRDGFVPEARGTYAGFDAATGHRVEPGLVWQKGKPTAFGTKQNLVVRVIGGGSASARAAGAVRERHGVLPP